MYEVKLAKIRVRRLEKEELRKESLEWLDRFEEISKEVEYLKEREGLFKMRLEELRKENARLKTKLSIDNRRIKGEIDENLAKELEELRIEVSRLRLIEEEYEKSKEMIELGKKFKFKQKKGVEDQTKSEVIFYYKYMKLSVKEVADKAGLGETTVRKILKENGVELRGRESINKNLENEVIDKVNNTNKTYKEIGEELGVNERKVKYIVGKYKKNNS